MERHAAPLQILEEVIAKVENVSSAFCDNFPSDEGCSTLLLWYVAMCIVCVVGNAILLITALIAIPGRDAYGTAMKLLAIPWVFESAYRTAFPSLYLQRLVFWDNGFNSIIVDRTFACAGELCWSFQFALALRFLDRQVTGGTTWVQITAWMTFVVYIAAECVSYYNVATTNELWAAIEVILDGVAFLFLAPGSLYLLLRWPHPHTPEENKVLALHTTASGYHATPPPVNKSGLRGRTLGRRTWSTGYIFIVLNLVFSIVYPLYNIAVDAPMYMSRYHADQQANKSYYPFLEGIEDAATRRVVSHRWEDWKQVLSRDFMWNMDWPKHSNFWIDVITHIFPPGAQDLFWMTAYFSVGAWSAIFLMFAPRLG